MATAFHRIVDLHSGELIWKTQIAEALVLGFAEHWPDAWPDRVAAEREIEESFEEGRISRVALDRDGRALGWIGGIRQYEGHVWELHPLVVHPDFQGMGIGRALVEDFEEQARGAGGSTIWLGTDDENGMTSLAGEDLYPDLLGKLAEIKNLRGHPFGFYLAMGFSLAGVVPDANGPGKPDILMAKRIRAS